MTYKTLIRKLKTYDSGWVIEDGEILDNRRYDPVRSYYHQNVATPTGSTAYHAEQLKLPIDEYTEFYIACICPLHLINSHLKNARTFRKAMLKAFNLEEDNVPHDRQQGET